MLVTARIIHNLRNLGLSDFVAENTNNGDTLFMNGQHNLKGLRVIKAKKSFKHNDNKLHWRVIIIQQKNLVQWGPFCARFGFYQYVCVTLIIFVVA